MFFFLEKAFNVVGTEVVEQSGSKAVAGKKTGAMQIITIHVFYFLSV